ncbi:unnamed protein product [Rhizophagus irregularis]|uniref:Uncharacterized protein n=1 Tax=Rhizophagus irregularis TaxID=588596 RepID=A0A2I1GDW3_9GLOM|nr:hypothetical protein RhiirA4_459230 [Rhizophagus irregularis]CAB4414582.1 unnamed protein product [Rhizophagus irregularis]
MKEARSKKSLVALSKEEQSKFKIIEGIQIRENVLSAISDDDPELVIQWNSEAFNNVNNSRDGDPTHTIANLVEYIKSAGAKIYTTKTWSLGFKQNAIFLNAFITYQTGRAGFLQCRISQNLSKLIATLVNMTLPDLIWRLIGLK